MEATELRIGNYVEAEGYYPFGDIDGIEKETVRIGVTSYLLSAILPIKLTEEWLLKFGFVKGIGEYRIGNYSYNIWNKMVYVKEEEVTKVDLLFVHQLQNLFYSLCGEELTIKD